MPEVKVPWEKDGEEFDAGKAKSYLTAILEDRDKAREERDTYKTRLTEATSGKKAATGREKELQQENVRLKVQMQTGLSDRQIQRLVGNTEEELLEDAELFAEETGIELRNLIESNAGTTDDESGGDDEGRGEEQSKSFSANYRTPSGQSLAGRDEPDFAGIIEGLEIG